MTKEIIIGNLQLNYSIRKLAVEFLIATQSEKLKGRGGRAITPEPEEILFDGMGVLIYKWEVNVACDCHPEYETRYVEATVEEFIKWVEDNNKQIE